MGRGRGRPSRASIYEHMDEAIRELRSRFGGLPSPAEAEDIWTDLWREEAHNSTALEGNTLIRQEVEKLLADGKAVGSKPLKDYMEVRGYSDAAQWVYGQALEPGEWNDGSLITVQEVRHIHYILMTPVWTVKPHPDASDQEEPGNYRRHEIAAFSEGMQPPSWPEVDQRMRNWVDTACALREPSDAPLPEQLAGQHSGFEQVHPFIDGNGRTGRLVLNLMLGRLGYPPAIIHKRDRDKYLRALQRADGGDPGPLGEMIARSVTGNLYRFVVPAVAGPARLVPLAALASGAITENALRVAAARSKLRAVKGEDGQWRSSRNWVDQYLENRYRRTPAASAPAS